MDDNDFTPKGRAQSNWRLLGQSDLSIDATSQKLSHSWLLHILVPISLPTDLANKIKLSIDEALSQFSLPSESSRIEVRIFIAGDIKADQDSNKNWGYFKLEKTGCDAEAGHIIEYYIYLEK